jgi:outer membrane protein
MNCLAGHWEGFQERRGPTNFLLPQFLCLLFCCLGLARAEQVPDLTLQEAHASALKNHPRISVAELTALASQQTARQARSGLLPQVAANVVAVGTAEDNTRLTAIGGLNNPTVFDRNAEGLTITQLITDFGRTWNLSRSAKLRARAAEEKTQATREQILLAVDGAFYSALQAQAVTQVAEQTLTNRQILLERVSTMATNKLRSELDVSFARVNVDDAQMLLSKAQNDLKAGYAQLSNLMGLSNPGTFRLLEGSLPAPASTNVSDLVQEALRNRPDLLAVRSELEAAQKFARAERALHYPTISALASVGVTPIRPSQLEENYAAAGVVLGLPLYAGGQYSARQKEAELRSQAAAESVRESENNVIRDVQVTWLNARNALERLEIARKLLENAKQSLALAQARYTEGISSMVEVNQAQLSEVSAEIAYANTRYEYLLQRSALSFETGSLR